MMQFLLLFFGVFFSFCLPQQQAQAQEVKSSPPVSEEMKRRILDEAHVRGFIWGLPPSVIKDKEPGHFVEEADDGTLFFVDKIDGLKSSLTYEFEDNKLSRVRIFSERTYTRPQDRIRDLTKVKRYLDARFGEPLKEDFEWKSDRDKKFPNQWGWTVYRGDLNITITWADEETFVTGFLGSKRPYQPALFFVYEDAKGKQAKAKKALKIKPIIR
jgi:hypothetical protein